MAARRLELVLESRQGRTPLSFTAERLVVAGWVGKDREAVRRHIEELGRLGVPAPSRTPTYMSLWPAILTTAEEIEVTGPESSGEVECVLLRENGRLYVGVGSDHTDRGFEKHDIPASKQMCGKPLAAAVWDLDDVRGHLDRLILRSWSTRQGRRRLYQEGALAANRGVLELLQGIPEEADPRSGSLVLFCGTFAARDGIETGELFEFEMEDPVTGRRIAHRYRIRRLPQFL